MEAITLVSFLRRYLHIPSQHLPIRRDPLCIQRGDLRAGGWAGGGKGEREGEGECGGREGVWRDPLCIQRGDLRAGGGQGEGRERGRERGSVERSTLHTER